MIEPIYDPVSGARLFHIASHNLYDSKILTRNTLANKNYFTLFLLEIYRAYAQLASSIAPNLKKLLVDSKHEMPTSFDMVADVNDYLENDFIYGIPGCLSDIKNKEQRKRYF